jgi:hypothetical protein
MAEGGSVYCVPVAVDRPLALTVGCTFGLETPQPVSAVLQVAPSGRDLQVRAEHWETGADHHGYLDLFGNRCERATIPEQARGSVGYLSPETGLAENWQGVGLGGMLRGTGRVRP